MSTHFAANQYEDAFRSNRLQNYGISNKYREHPVARTGATKVIANDRGHIIHPGRRSAESPWGNYLGTWDLSRQHGTKFSNPTAIRKDLSETEPELPASPNKTPAPITPVLPTSAPTSPAPATPASPAPSDRECSVASRMSEVDLE